MSRPERIRAGQSVALPRDFLVAAQESPPIELSVHRKLADIAEEWRAFEAIAAGTFYQTYAWCEAWIESSGEPFEPRIIIGRDRNGGIRFLLPLCIQRRHGMSILEWIATPQST